MDIAWKQRPRLVLAEGVAECLALCDEIGRVQVGVDMGDEAERRHEDVAFRPPGERRRLPFVSAGKQGRLRVELLKLAQDELRVAVDVGADLHHRRAAIAARERDEVRLRHHDRGNDFLVS